MRESSWSIHDHFFAILNVIPIMASTDAHSSICCATRDDAETSFWCCVLNDLPSFNAKKLNEHCSRLRSKFESQPGVLEIVNFLQHSCVNDNPWLIELGINFLNDLKVGTAPLNALKVLDHFLDEISAEFILRKRSGLQHNTGQINYRFGYTLKDQRCVVNEGPVECINRHLARLKATPLMPGEPYFKLDVKESSVCEHLGDDEDAESSLMYYDPRKATKRDFTPKSYFPHFTDAPLTGLVLFGLNTSTIHPSSSTTHSAFVTSSTRRGITTFDGIARQFKRMPKSACEEMLERNPNGAHLEFLYHAAALVASRANGVAGCPFSVFLKRLIYELSSTEERTLPRLNCPKHFDQTIIPVVAPMKTPAWPKSVANMLKGIVGDSPIHLGVIDTATGKNPVDSIIYRLFPECDKEKESSSKKPRVEPDPENEAPPKPAKQYGFKEEVIVTPDYREPVLLCECKE